MPQDRPVSLIGHRTFEGNYNDESGKGNDAKANGDPTLIKFGPGVNGGQSVELDNESADTQFLSESVTGNYDLFWGAWRGEPGYSIQGNIDDTVVYDAMLK